MADPSQPNRRSPVVSSPPTASAPAFVAPASPAGSAPAVPVPASAMPPAAAHPPAEPAHPGASLAPTGVAPESDVRTHSPGAAAPSHPPPAGGPGGLNEGLGELPSGYQDGRLVCLVRDPSCAYVYWDLSHAQIEQAFGGLGVARAALKLWSLKGELTREVEVHLEARGWYLRELTPGAELRVELWALGEQGSRMLRAARPLRLPPAAPSDELDEQYLALPLDAALAGVLPSAQKRSVPLPAWSGGAMPVADPERALPWSGTAAPKPGSSGQGPGGPIGET